MIVKSRYLPRQGLAVQLAIYRGYVRAKILGATLVSIVFINYTLFLDGVGAQGADPFSRLEMNASRLRNDLSSDISISDNETQHKGTVE